MEATLKVAAELLPEPALDFQTVEQSMKVTVKPIRKNRKALRVALAAVLILSLGVTVFAYGDRKYGLWTNMRSQGYGDVKLLSWKYDYEFPEKFQELPFSDMSTLHGVHQGASQIEAMLNPAYIMHTVDYGEYSGTAQSDGTVDYDGKLIRISFGTTEGETWKYHFSIGEDGFCEHESVISESKWKTEYEGYLLYVHSVDGGHMIHWEDIQRQMIFRLRGYGFETQEEVLETAKTLIDMNR